MMFEQDELRALRGEERALVVDAARGEVLEVYVGDALPPVGRALRIGGACVARVTRHLGQRRVAALLLSAHPAAVVGASVEVLAGQAMFPAPEGARLVLEGASFVEEGGLSWEVARPGWLELDPARPALLLGDDVLDTLCPLAARGMNLVVDAGRSPRPFERLAGHAIGALGADEVIVLGEIAPELPGRRVSGRGMVAWRAVVAWACEARDAGRSVAVVGALEVGGEEGGEQVRGGAAAEGARNPPTNKWSSEEGGATLGQAVELLGAGLVSTRRGAITTLVRLALPGSALEEVAETLSLGDVDAQLMLRSSGRVDASRSRSRSEVSEALMGRRMAAQAALAEADALALRQRIFGSDELTDAERALLEETRRWR